MTRLKGGQSLIPTVPSECFDDFLDFCRKAFGAKFPGPHLGASQETITLFARICGFPLPQLYVDYLRVFGRNDGILRLHGDAATDLETLVRVYQAKSQYIPPGTVVIGLEALTGGRALYYTEGSSSLAPLSYERGKRQSEPRSLSHFGIICTAKHMWNPISLSTLWLTFVCIHPSKG